MYLRGDDSPENRPDWDMDVFRYVALVGGQTVGMCTVHKYQMTRGEAVLPGGGVASVGVRPEFRHKRYGSVMMVELLRKMRENGLTMAALYAFRESFYRKFGYESSGFRVTVKVPSHRMPALQQELEPRRISADELHLLKPCYEAFAHSVSGAVIRTPEQWKIRMGQRAPMIYAFGDPVEGYCWTSMEGGFWDDISFGEVIYSTPRGYRSCLAFIRGLCINRKCAEWLEPTPSPFYAQYMDQGVEMEEDRTSMYRVLNVPKALESLQTSATGAFTFRVDDAQLPENEGPWRVEFSSAGVEVSRFSGTADWSCDIQAFTQALLGDPSFDSLRRFGKVAVHQMDGFYAAAQLLTPATVFCTEFF